MNPLTSKVIPTPIAIMAMIVMIEFIYSFLEISGDILRNSLSLQTEKAAPISIR